MTRARAIGIVLIAGSALCLALCIAWIETAPIEPLTAQVGLSPGHKIFKFHTSISHSYGIQIYFSHLRVPQAEVACALGINNDDPRYPPACQGREPLLNLTWTLIGSGRTVPQSRFEGYYYGTVGRNHDATRYLNVFEAKEGEDFTLDLNIKSNPRILTNSDPILHVHIGSLYEETQSVVFSVVLFATILCIGIGLLVIIFDSRRRLKV